MARRQFSSLVKTFDRIAWYLHDYADMMHDIQQNDPAANDTRKMRDEARALAHRAEELRNDFERPVKFGGAREAAGIVADMLVDWSRPGAVWYLPSAKRFRLVGEEYNPIEGEACVGVYMPGILAEQLAPDFAAIMSKTLAPIADGARGEG